VVEHSLAKLVILKLGLLSRIDMYVLGQAAISHPLRTTGMDKPQKIAKNMKNIGKNLKWF